MKLTDAILEKLSEEEEFPDFVCPNCGGAFFSASPNEDLYECDTITDSYRCKWKGSGASCLVPARASLAQEILALRRSLSAALPHVEMASDLARRSDPRLCSPPGVGIAGVDRPVNTSSTQVAEAEILLAEMRKLLGSQS